MRVFAVTSAFVSLIAVAILAGMVVKLRRELGATRREVADLRSALGASQGGAPADFDGLSERPAPVRAALPPPRLNPAALAPAAGSQPGVASVATASEVKQEVQRLVAEEMAQERQRREQRREQRDVQFRERAAGELGLSPAEKERFVAVLTSTQAERRRLRDQERSGEKTALDIRPELEALRQKTEQSLREILGDERLQKYQALRAAERGPGRGFMGAGAPPPPPAQ
jgi:hypothetical protein